jgi:hypothetical protein
LSVSPILFEEIMRVRILHTDNSGMSLQDCNAGRATILMSWDELESHIIAGRVKKKGRFIRGRTFTIKDFVKSPATIENYIKINNRLKKALTVYQNACAGLNPEAIPEAFGLLNTIKNSNARPVYSIDGKTIKGYTCFIRKEDMTRIQSLAAQRG